MKYMSKSENTVNVRGVYFDNVNMDEAVEIAMGFIASEGCDYIVTPNAEIVQSCIENPENYGIMNSSSMTIPDGIGVVYAAKILGTPLKGKVAGCELAEHLIGRISKTGDGVYFFGGGKATEDKPCIAKQAADKLTEKYPGLVVSGYRDGYFKEEDVPGIIEDINDSGAKLLFVCLGAPKQEKWIFANRDKLAVHLAIGLGGSLDVFSGNVKRAPRFFIKCNLEWFYRLLCMPSRIGRMMKLPKFLFGTMIHKNRNIPTQK